MRVLITGAAGRLGLATGNALAARGHDVLGCDLRPAAGAGFPIRLADLGAASAGELRELLAGREALVHFAGYASARLRAPGDVFAHNTALDARLLGAALEAGVGAVVFASSIQVINGESGAELESETFRPGRLPLDGEAPPLLHPENGYARAKRATEERLEELARAHPGRRFVALRFPWVVDPARHRYEALRPRARSWAREAFCFLPLAEAPRVVEAVLRAAPAGYRCYLPAARENLFFEPAAVVAARELAGVPIAGRAGELVALARDLRLESETGWVPAPVACPAARGRGGAAGRVSRWWLAGKKRAARAWARLGVANLGPARAALRAGARLGEGPCWDEAARCIHWVDIAAGELHRFDPATGADERLALGQTVGAVAAVEGGGRLLVARQESLAWVEPVGGAGARVTPHAAGRLEGPPNRLNDGKCDAAGRFWVGSMSQHWGERSGALFCVEPGGRVRRVLEGVACSNGLGWSPDGRVFYYIDSGNRALEAFDFDLERGELARRRTVRVFAAHEGLPDGLCVDAEGLVWVAMHGGGQVLRVEPARGRVVGRVAVPASKVTSCAFGGSDLRELYITSAREGLSVARLAAEPEAGSLFVARVGVAGLAAFRAR